MLPDFSEQKKRHHGERDVSSCFRFREHGETGRNCTRSGCRAAEKSSLHSVRAQREVMDPPSVFHAEAL